MTEIDFPLLQRQTDVAYHAMTLGFIAALAVGVATPAAAQETTTYTYDALGRVTQVQHNGGAANGTTSTYTYDPAGNRTNVQVNGSPNGNANSTTPGNGASVPHTTYVIVPLNGFTVIPIPG